GAIDPVAYADSLLQSAAALLGATPLRNPLVASFSSASSPLELRVTTMIDPRRDHTARLRVLPLLGFTACLGLATVASALAWPSPGDVGAEIRIADAGPVDGRIVDGSFGTPADASRLFHAISSGDVEAVRAAVDRGASVDQTWFGDGSPLIVAARQGDLEIVEFLVQSGADLDRAVSGDGTALVQAVRHDHREVVESLLRAGADIDADGAPGDGTALIEAAHRSDLTMLELLLAWGADPNLAVMGDDTPLIAAVQRGSLQTVQRLLDAGADPNGEGDVDLRVDGRRTPLNQARLQGLDEIERLLRATGARE
ncbi:MAG: ankyrin repeat domain-containing protein, partial [Acidobacteriota bacterium]